MVAKKLRKASVVIAEAGPWWKRTKLAMRVGRAVGVSEVAEEIRDEAVG